MSDALTRHRYSTLPHNSPPPRLASTPCASVSDGGVVRYENHLGPARGVRARRELGRRGGAANGAANDFIRWRDGSWFYFLLARDLHARRGTESSTMKWSNALNMDAHNNWPGVVALFACEAAVSANGCYVHQNFRVLIRGTCIIIHASFQGRRISRLMYRF